MPTAFLNYKLGRLIVLALATLLLVIPDRAQVPTSDTTPKTVAQYLAASAQFVASSDLDEGARQASLALQLDPKSAAAYEQRGSIYLHEKLWDRAERDYVSADKISPDVAYKYKLADIKFLQRSYDDARLRFVRLQSDERLGDLATYKAFLCDLLSSQDDAALRDIKALDPAAQKPSFFYCRAAWDLVHNNRAEANGYLNSASQLFGGSIADLYFSSLLESQRFQPTVATFVTKDGKFYQNARVYLEREGLRVGTDLGWKTLPLDQLPDDLSAFPNDIRDLIVQRRQSTAAVISPTELISFVTKSGKTYADVRWSVVDGGGLSVLGPDGWVTIPFAQLPTDLSAFPQDLQQSVKNRVTSTSISPLVGVISFTTKQGKPYDQVRASLTDNGVRVLTADGWITVPFFTLPDDLSSFPADWRQPIQTKRDNSVSDDLEMKVVTFTTRKGNQYTDVRGELEHNGVHLLTSQGWVEIPFNQLPEDLSAFPEKWQKTIAERQIESQSSGSKK